MIPQGAKIYIAGHKGLVGSAILRKFKQENYQNIILYTHEELDLIKQPQVEKFFDREKPEYVIIAAARVGGIKANMTYPAEFLYENLMIQNNLIWTSHLKGVKKLMFLGSSCIYPRESLQPMKEECLLTGDLEPTNEGYAIAKIAGLKLCQYIFKEFHQPYITAIPSNLYGPNDNFDPSDSHVVSAMIRKFLEAKQNNLPSVEIWGSGSARRDFMHVDDLADAIYFLMQNYDSSEPINVGIGSDISIKELINIIKEITRYQGQLKFDITKPDGMPIKLMDTTKILALGWKPRISLKEGLKDTIDWYKIFSSKIL